MWDIGCISHPVQVNNGRLYLDSAKKFHGDVDTSTLGIEAPIIV